jgi:1,4-dihydroxy-2-naphthoyl-CoA hydrolase
MIWKNKFDVDILNNISRDTMVQHLGIRFTEVGDDYLVATMPVDQRTVQPMRLLHGGASVTLAETLGSVASYACIDPDRYNVVGIEVNANHLKSVREGSTDVKGKVTHIKLGKRMHVWNIEISDSEGNTVCVSRLTTMIIPK